MSQRCPRCRLFNPDEAVRCDCGYDFVSGTLQSSYLVDHLVEKHGGQSKVIADFSRARIRDAAWLLALVIIVAGGTYLALGRLYVGWWAALWAAVSLARGLGQRRRQTLDPATRKDLMRRP